MAYMYHIMPYKPYDEFRVLWLGLGSTIIAYMHLHDVGKIFYGYGCIFGELFDVTMARFLA